MSVDRLPTYSVAELNTAIGSLLERGFAPRFLLEATVSRPQLKKGHLWLTLTDGAASISGVVWASKLAQLSYRPADGDGVTVVGKLNFWAARASLTVQALDIRPSLSTVLRDFERVRQLLEQEGVIDPSLQRQLPSQPSTIAVLTSVPSSALADMLRTAAERWPLTQLIVVPIPVQGSVAPTIIATLEGLAERTDRLGIQALVLARGGGSREDLAVFDNEALCRVLARYPVPVVTGLGHEDDLTVADLVADHRAATPTAAMVALLPDREAERQGLVQRQSRMRDALLGRILRERQRLQDRAFALQNQSPLEKIRRQRHELDQKQLLLKALSPDRWLKRGLALVSNAAGDAIQDLQSVKIGDQLNIRMSDGTLEARVDQIQRSSPNPTP
ncbi:MAG: exodeoxyribonuclease VII large subunit [Synechococcus sp. BS301-5m-G53]|nr:exodeoxyribonuclease VII large subunit [Synechococcus sp. BS301-5m-G53]